MDIWVYSGLLYIGKGGDIWKIDFIGIVYKIVSPDHKGTKCDIIG
jgi:hypothetical protein